jgi:general stress protein 26
MNNETNDKQKLASVIKDIKFTMLSTVGQDGSIHSRPMGTLKLDEENFDGKLWFFSRKNSHKNFDIQNDQHVNLAYASPDNQQYVSVQGKAYLSSDKEKMKELWNPAFLAWFPEGLNDPELSLIEVRVERADLWDSPPGKVVQLVGFVKSVVTGKPYDENSKQTEHLDLQDSDVMSEEEKLDETIAESMIASDPPGHFSKSLEDKNLH